MSSRTQSETWSEFCRADERAAELLVAHVNAGGPTPCDNPEYLAADAEANRLYADYVRRFS